MNFTKQVRLEHGLTQEQLAQMLGISRSQLAQVETGRRNLSSEASKILFAVGFRYQLKGAKHIPAPAIVPTAKQLARMRAKVKSKLGDVQFKALRLQRKYDAMSAAYQQQLLGAAGLQKALDSAAKRKTPPHSNLHDMDRRNIIDRTLKGHPIDQAILDIEIKGLQLQVILLEQLLTKSPRKLFE